MSLDTRPSSTDRPFHATKYMGTLFSIVSSPVWIEQCYETFVEEIAGFAGGLSQNQSSTAAQVEPASKVRVTDCSIVVRPEPSHSRGAANSKKFLSL